MEYTGACVVCVRGLYVCEFVCPVRMCCMSMGYVVCVCVCFLSVGYVRCVYGCGGMWRCLCGGCL